MNQPVPNPLVFTNIYKANKVRGMYINLLPVKYPQNSYNYIYMASDDVNDNIEYLRHG